MDKGDNDEGFSASWAGVQALGDKETAVAYQESNEVVELELGKRKPDNTFNDLSV